MNLSHLALIFILAVSANYASQVSSPISLDDSSSTDSHSVFAVGDKATGDNSVDTHDQSELELAAVDKVGEDNHLSESRDDTEFSNANALDQFDDGIIQKVDAGQQDDDITDQEDTQVGI